jgi:hypothetical protein
VDIVELRRAKGKFVPKLIVRPIELELVLAILKNQIGATHIFGTTIKITKVLLGFKLGVTEFRTTKSKFVSSGGSMYGPIFEKDLRSVQSGRYIVLHVVTPAIPGGP